MELSRIDRCRQTDRFLPVGSVGVPYFLGKEATGPEGYTDGTPDMISAEVPAGAGADSQACSYLRLVQE